MSQVNVGPLLTNGLRLDFTGQYSDVRNRQRASWLGSIMDLNVPATNRQHEFAYPESAPHFRYWPRGSSIPTKGFDSNQWTNHVYNFGVRVPWHKDDRADDQTQSLFYVAQQSGQSAALNAERFAIECVTGTADLLPAVPLAPDGVAMFSATDGGGGARFGATGGNIIVGDTLGTTTNVQTNFYEAHNRFLQFLDTEGQPLLEAERLKAGFIILHSSDDTQIMEESFQQLRQGRVMGTDAGVTPSNVIIDSSRNVELVSTPRLPTGDWYVFLKEPPKQPLFLLDREPLKVYQALAENDNSDHTRDTGGEYIQFEKREGPGILLPFGAIAVQQP